MNQLFIGIILVLSLGSYWLYSENQTLTANNFKLETAVEELAVVEDYNWNTSAETSLIATVSFWWLLITIIGLSTFPILSLFLYKLPDLGYGLSKSFGLLILSYFVWIPSSLVGNAYLGNTFFTSVISLLISSVMLLRIAPTNAEA